MQDLRQSTTQLKNDVYTNAIAWLSVAPATMLSEDPGLQTMQHFDRANSVMVSLLGSSFDCESSEGKHTLRTSRAGPH